MGVESETAKGPGSPIQTLQSGSPSLSEKPNSDLENGQGNDPKGHIEPIVSLKTWVVACVCSTQQTKYHPSGQANVGHAIDPILWIWALLLASSSNVGHRCHCLS